MRAWIGKFIAGIGLIHSILGLTMFRDTFAALLRDGLVSTVNGQPEREFAFWFLAAGLFWVLLGALVDQNERAGHSLPGFFGWALGALALTGALMMPLSGWWLFLIPAAALIRRSSTREGTT